MVFILFLILCEENRSNTVQPIKPREPPVLSGFTGFPVHLPILKQSGFPAIPDRTYVRFTVEPDGPVRFLLPCM